MTRATAIAAPRPKKNTTKTNAVLFIALENSF